MELLAHILLFIGVAIVVVSSLAAVWLPNVFVRLHYLSPVTSLGGPFIGLALAIHNGWGLTTALILFIVFVVGFTGPVMNIAIGRLLAQREGVVPQESPE